MNLPTKFDFKCRFSNPVSHIALKDVICWLDHIKHYCTRPRVEYLTIKLSVDQNYLL